MKKLQINRMLRKSFGRGVRGDYGRSKDEIPIYGYISDEGLHFIVRQTRPHGLLSLTFSYEEIGRFESQDGSILSVKEEYSQASKRYSELYFQKMGVPVIVKFLTGKGKYVPFINEGTKTYDK